MTDILYVGLIRLADFHDFVNHEFGPQHGPWLLHPHVLTEYGKASAELLEDGVEPRDIWWALCREHDVLEDHWYGPDKQVPAQTAENARLWPLRVAAIRTGFRILLKVLMKSIHLTRYNFRV